MRRHPVLFGILFLICAGFVFFLVLNGLLKSGGGGYALPAGDKVAIVTLEGVITNSDRIIREIEAFAKNDRVKAIVLRIDSPGGSVAPTQEIYDAVLEAGKKKKIVASMGSIAASGGYLVACAADQIVANPGTITGSISAVMHFANMEELMRKIGVSTSVVKSGKYKDIGSPAREMTEEEISLLQQLVDDVYDQLLETISVRRKITKENLSLLADGRILTGRQAQKAGLVDFLGNQKYAVRLAGQMTGISGDPAVVYPPEKKAFILDFLLKSLVRSVKQELVLDQPKMDGLQYLYCPQ
ncbi:MAG: signal peptide peptidase SppA [Deltaproteobacteria bacterium]|jgi:protease-4|nr:signal peptide peptidase SppA [Deltaproteobacteria bacterium]